MASRDFSDENIEDFMDRCQIQIRGNTRLFKRQNQASKRGVYKQHYHGFKRDRRVKNNRKIKQIKKSHIDNIRMVNRNNKKEVKNMENQKMNQEIIVQNEQEMEMQNEKQDFQYQNLQNYYQKYYKRPKEIIKEGQKIQRSSPMMQKALNLKYPEIREKKLKTYSLFG